MLRKYDLLEFFTARKRSLGQGNIFKSVYQEFCPRGGGGGSASVHAGITPPWEQTPPPCYWNTFLFLIHSRRNGELYKDLKDQEELRMKALSAEQKVRVKI